MASEFTTTELGQFAAGTAGGLLGGTVAALSRPMTRREVFFAVTGGLGIGAFLPPAILSWADADMGAGAIGFVGGVSVFGVISGLQAFSNRWLKRTSDQIIPEDKSPGGPK